MCVYVFFVAHTKKKAGQEDRTKDATLDLLCKCLLYDFSGTTIDESGEETGIIQVTRKKKKKRKKKRIHDP
jgi:hypothetical protein